MSSPPPAAHDSKPDQTAPPPTAEAHDQMPEYTIEAEPALSDIDSAYGEEIDSYTSSLSSSVTAYPVEHGRRYHAYSGDSAWYILPNDEPERDRLDMTHQMMTETIKGALHLAPIGKHPQRILDIGTGTGIWAIEMGDKYPSAQVIGNDLSPIQPSFVPPNVHFEVDDVEKVWTHQPFDYIHCRYMATAILDWPLLFKRCYQYTKPGGWAEFQDFDLQYYSQDGSLTPSHHITVWINALLDASRKVGREPCPGPKLEGWLRDAGFVRVTHVKYPVPIGIWPKDPALKRLGGWNLMQIMDGLDAFTLRLFTKVLDWTVEEVTVLLGHVRNDLKDRKIHAMFDFHVAYGQKPVEGKEAGS